MFDTHVHAAPDVLERIGDDLDIAKAYGDADFDGFVLKAHYESTVGRAHTVAHATGQSVYGGIALNQHCGGINPTAAAAALTSGGRVVWMPTADAHTHRAAGLPALCQHEPRLSAHAYAGPPVDPRTTDDTERVLALVADHDAVLATGHLGGSECHWLADRARHYGITRLLLTHPSYTVPALDPTQVADLVALGCYAEITAFQLFHQRECTPAMLARVAEAAGDRLVLSSDAGQPDSPTPPDALNQLIDTLAAEGLDRSRLKAAASTIPAALVTP